jgi:hypothetical protein
VRLTHTFPHPTRPTLRESLLPYALCECGTIIALPRLGVGRELDSVTPRFCKDRPREIGDYGGDVVPVNTAPAVPQLRTRRAGPLG